MLGWRLAVSAILIPTLFAIFWLDHRAGSNAPWLFAFCLLLTARSTWELSRLLTTRAMRPSWLVSLLGALLIVAGVWIARWSPGDNPLAEHWLQLGLSVHFAGSLILVKAAVTFREPGSTMETIGAELFTVFYCGYLLALTAQLRWIDGGDLGYAALGSLLIAVKCGDIGGYTLGRLIGKRKMAPRLSPGKTWAGFAGALLGAAGGTWLWATFAIPHLAARPVVVQTVNVLAFGLVLGFVGLLGDLCESLIKRDVGQKDAAALFPGFGGLLDLLDSVLFAGPIAWVWWTVSPLIH